MRERIAKKDYECLFTGGACFFFAVVLHENLSLPLFYASTPENRDLPSSYVIPPHTDEYLHVFVKRDDKCIDFSGPHTVAEIAKKYSGWDDVPPKPTTVEKVRAKIKEKDFGHDLEAQLFQIAREQYAIRSAKYLESCP